MTHLSRSELLRWRDAPVEADRAGIIGHLAVCDACSSQYAKLVRTRPLEHASPALDVRAFIVAGASRPVSSFDRGQRVRGGTLRWVMAAAAVAVLAVLSWQMFEGQRLRAELTRAEAARVTQEQERLQQARAEQARGEQLNQQLQEERNARVLLERELARQREPLTANGATSGAVISLFLTPGRIRAGGETKAVSIPSGATDLRLVLDLGERRSYRSYDVAILNADGIVVWTRSRIPPGEQLVMVGVPAKLLPEDDYEINLKGLNASSGLERVGDYYFTVLRR